MIALRVLAGMLLGACLVTSCAKQSPLQLLPNEPPSVEFTSTPPALGTIGNYSYDLRWAGRDRDGRIEYFQYAVDPSSRASADTLWVTTRQNRQVFSFTADSLGGSSGTVARRSHTVALRAVDDRGGISPVVWVTFTASNILPSIKITSPSASKLISPLVAPDFRVSWTTVDADARSARLPVAIRYKLFGVSSTPSIDDIVLDPDTLMATAGPAFADWDSLPGSATGLNLRGLQPGVTYLLATVAIDEAGGVSAPFSLDSNILRFTVSTAAAVGPILTVTSPYFSVGYSQGGFFSAPSTYFHVEVPAGRRIPVDWSAKSRDGSFVTGFRWAVDLASLDDETPRQDEATDVSRWSQWQLGSQAELPAVDPAEAGQTHLFFLEARDNVGALSLVVIAYTAVAASFDRDLLIVDDTRFARDVRLASGCVQAPRGVWPTASELDTFLFARGGVPWRCYPSGTLTTPGVFSGYAYDSLVTFGAGNTLSLSRLSHYRHIVWMVNGDFVLSNDVTLKFPLLRSLSQTGAANPLQIWLGLGGKLWVVGGGIGAATQIDFEVQGSPSNVFDSASGELAPGRFMYNFPHWRSEITGNRTNGAVRSARAVGGWAGAPDYARLPSQLEGKTAATDPPAPNRSNSTDFYRTNCIVEYLSKPNVISEADFATGNVSSVLDTLYETQGGTAGNGFPIMTLYHGSASNGLVCSGFPIWYFQREQAIQLIDWVLQDYWGLPRRPVPR